MSARVRCVVCDARLNPYGGGPVCERCKEPCPTCGGDVAHCQHPLRPERAELEPKELPNGRWQVAA